MLSQELQEKTRQFALKVINLVGELPETVSGREVGSKLVKAGTAVGAGCRAAARARSRGDYLRRIASVLDSADECAFWLELIIESGLQDMPKVVPLFTEVNDIAAEINAARIAAKQSAGKKSKNKNKETE